MTVKGRRLFGIDFGERRIGLAVSDRMGIVVTPVRSIQRRPGKRVPVNGIVEQARAYEADAFVLGLPLDEQGEETARCAEVRALAAELQKRTSLPTHLVDERFTTAAAHRAIREMGGSTRGRKGDVDSLAATILVQHALNSGL